MRQSAGCDAGRPAPQWGRFGFEGDIMAQTIVITLERELPDASAAYMKSGTGKALARESDRIDSAARRRGVTPPTGLLSESQAALIAQMKEEGFDPAKMRLP